MISTDIPILIAFLSFHTFFLVLVRPYTLAVFENFSIDTSRVKMKLKKIKENYENADFEAIYNKYRDLEKFLAWEGVLSNFSSNYWIFAILVGLGSIIGNKNDFVCFEKWFFIATLAYLIWTIIVFKVRYSYFIFYDRPRHVNLFLSFNIFFFYIIPSLIYLAYKYKVKIIQIANKEELSIIYIVWLLSIIYFCIWHSLWAIYAPFSKLKDLREAVGLADPE
jgi:hypothetical protein